jgi:hypothetical protein
MNKRRNNSSIINRKVPEWYWNKRSGLRYYIDKSITKYVWNISFNCIVIVVAVIILLLLVCFIVSSMVSSMVSRFVTARYKRRIAANINYRKIVLYTITSRTWTSSQPCIISLCNRSFHLWLIFFLQ